MTSKTNSKLQIFRTQDAVPLEETEHMEIVGMTDEIIAGATRVQEAGFGAAYDTRVVFSSPDMSLTYAWFKSDYPLPRHSHDSDCLYYVIAGSIQFGKETLRKGDGFLLPADMPYAYVAGPDGVEILEFRNTSSFNFKWLTHGPAFWESTLATIERKRDDWQTEQPPLGAGNQDKKPD